VGCCLAQKNYRGWEAFGGGPENLHYSSLKQINTKNVDRLKLAWTFDSGDAYQGSDMQCNPIVVDGMLYATTPALRLVALDAASGKQIWSFDGLDGRSQPQESRAHALGGWQAIAHLLSAGARTAFDRRQDGQA
jgi:quinoprotein glucose dehydrogenase